MSSLRSANDYFKLGLKCMQSSPPRYEEASCIFRFLYQNIPESEREKIVKFIVQCGVGLHDKELMSFVSTVESKNLCRQCELASFMLNDKVHKEKRDECQLEVDEQSEFWQSDNIWDDVILVCAGGDKLLQQLYCNLKSLEKFWYTGSNELENIPIVIAHADEIRKFEEIKIKNAFTSLNIVFFDIAQSALILESRFSASSLRGYQIKIAAMVAIRARRVLLMDADILWLRDPRKIIEKCKKEEVDAHLFSDFWHFMRRRHEKSSSTSFLYSLYGVDFDVCEFESGVVYLNREKAYKSVAMLRYILMNYEYYFSLAFGDKDLFYLSLKKENAKISISGMPKMLGCVYDEGHKGRDANVFYSQSMVQSFDSVPSHIHTTLHPVGDEGFDVPSHLCEDGEKIEFVQRKIDEKIVSTVACDISNAVVLEKPNVYEHVYICAMRDKYIYLKEK